MSAPFKKRSMAVTSTWPHVEVFQGSILNSQHEFFLKKVAVPTVYHQELVLMEMGLMFLHAVRQKKNNGPN